MRDARALRRLLSDEHLEALRQTAGDRAGRIAALREMASGIDDTEDAVSIAGRASHLLEAEAKAERGRLSSERRFDLMAALYGGASSERGEAAAKLDAAALWTGPSVIGTLAPVGAETLDGERWLDGSIPALAIAIAARELEGDADAAASWREAEGLIEDDPSAPDRMEAALDRLQCGFAANARLAGENVPDSRARALSARSALAGRMRARAAGVAADDPTPFLVGAGAWLAASGENERTSAAYESVRPDIFVRIGKLRRVDDHDGFARLAGAAAAGAAFGFSGGWRDAGPAHLRIEGHEHEDGVLLIVDGIEPLFFDHETLAPLLILSVDAALRRLRASAHDIRGDGPEGRRMARLAEAAEAAAHGWRRDRLPFARLLGLAEAPVRTGALHDGQRVHPAVPVGRFRSVIVCQGSRGRRITCRALADDEGRLVGYRTFDPLSRSYFGEPRHAIYALDGRRAGHLAFDERGMAARLREPRGGFVTAPDAVNLGSAR